MVFDIHRSSFNDGPGIRTTVFLKGCPLTCLWCHNPESRAHKPELSYDPTKCSGCHAAVSACPTGALTLDHSGRLHIDRSLCNACGACEQACVHGAFRIIGREWTVDEVLDVVLRDTAYYERSSGGMTVSGGEPLAQPRFAKELLQHAKEYGIHTCLDTSGAVAWSRLEDVLPYVDLFLYDYKGTDEALHVAHTGVSRDRVLDNLSRLHDRGARVALRCPLVPGVNDSEDHLEGIVALDRRFPDLVSVEIMVYHDMGKAKAAHVGQVNVLGDLPSTDATTKARWLQSLHAAGCTRAFLG